MHKVAFIKSDDRKYNVTRSLSLLKSEVVSVIKESKRIVVKPNCVIDNVQLAATHRDALDSLLSFIAPHASQQIVLAEGAGIGDTMSAFKNYGYLSLQEKYDLALIDLNEDAPDTIDLIDKHGKKWQAQFAKTLLESDCIISISPPKTHDSVVYTGAIKNVSVAGLIRPSINHGWRIMPKLGATKNNKSAIHQGPAIINENIRRLYEHLKIRLAVIDGYTSMEGDGPIEGTMVPTHYAIASTSALAVDSLACVLMGIKLEDVGYLTLLEAEKNECFIVGDSWEKSVTKFTMHRNFESIRKWR
ncbi:MAG: DUF362 domain-containing protein [Patescibacteria group bacterium]|jgi:uncharacterized protein (DUF362 family)